MKKFYLSLLAVGCAITVSASALGEKLERMDNVAILENQTSKTTLSKSNIRLLDLPENTVSNEVCKAPTGGIGMEDWKDAGTVSYTEDCITSLYNIEPITLSDVKIEESVTTPGLYRLVDPYKGYIDAVKDRDPNEVGFNPALATYDSSTSHYMYIHTEGGNEYVYFEECSTGLILDASFGEIVVDCPANWYVEAYPNYPLEELAAAD